MFCRYEEIAWNRGPLIKLRSISVYVRTQVFSILKVQFTYISLGFFILSWFRWYLLLVINILLISGLVGFKEENRKKNQNNRAIYTRKNKTRRSLDAS